MKAVLHLRNPRLQLLAGNVLNHFLRNTLRKVAAENDKELLALIRLCKRGDRWAQSQLYKRFYHFGLSICLRYSGNLDEAREIVNDAFFNIFTRFHQYDEKRAFVNWARQIFVHASIDYLRKYKSKPEHDELPDYPVHGLLPDIAQWMESEELYKLVAQLSPQYRMVYCLYEIDGYNHQEIAEMLGISEGTSKSNLARARKRMEAIASKYLESLKRDTNEGNT